jgi:hypothetical protein
MEILPMIENLSVKMRTVTIRTIAGLTRGRRYRLSEHCTSNKHSRGAAMSNLKDQVKDKIDDTADAAKKTTGKVVDKAKNLTHKAGEAIEKGAKRLQDV